MGWKLFVAACFCLVLTGFTYPRDEGAVTDSAHLLSAQVERGLGNELIRFGDETGVFIQVVTVTPSQLGSERLTNYSRSLFANWQSHFPRDARRVVLVMVASRGFRILASQAERSTFDDDAIAQLSRRMLPSFQRGEYSESLLCSVHAIEQRACPGFQPNSSQPPASASPNLSTAPVVYERTIIEMSDKWSTLEIVAIVVAILVLIALCVAFLIWVTNQRSSRRSHGVMIGGDTVEAAGEVGGRAASSFFDGFSGGGDCGGGGGFDIDGGGGDGGSFGGDGGFGD